MSPQLADAGARFRKSLVRRQLPVAVVAIALGAFWDRPGLRIIWPAIAAMALLWPLQLYRVARAARLVLRRQDLSEERRVRMYEMLFLVLAFGCTVLWLSFAVLVAIAIW